MKVTELRLVGMDGNFGLVDERWYYAAASSDETNGISNHILLIPNNSNTNNYSLILWQKAIPARQRIKDDEEVLKWEFIDTINPAEIQSIDPRVISSAAEELLVTIPTVNTFYQTREY